MGLTADEQSQSSLVGQAVIVYLLTAAAVAESENIKTMSVHMISLCEADY